METRRTSVALSIVLFAVGCGGTGTTTSALKTGGESGAAASSGGSSGAGAGAGVVSEGNDPPPAHIVTDCSALGPVDQWDEITPAGVDPTKNGFLSVVSDPNTEGTVYAGTEKAGLWRSTNCGASWTKINTGRDADVLNSGSLWFLKADPGKADSLYLGSLYGSDPSLLKSTDGGANFDSLFPAGSNVASSVSYNFFQDAGIDITNPKHVVASFHADCTGDTGPMCLAESNDSGQTWRLFKGPRPGWGERAGMLVFDATTYIYHTWGDGIFYTHDSGATWENVASGSNFQMYKASDGYFYLGSAYGMVRSQDGHTWTKVGGTAPNGDALVGDGVRIFTAWGDTSPQFMTAMETDATTWTSWKVPDKFTHRVGTFAYDNGHHILYSANTTDGLWRVVTK